MKRFYTILPGIWVNQRNCTVSHNIHISDRAVWFHTPDHRHALELCAHLPRPDPLRIGANIIARASFSPRRAAQNKMNSICQRSSSAWALAVLLLMVGGSESQPKHGHVAIDGRFSSLLEATENLISPRPGHLRAGGRSLLEEPTAATDATATTTNIDSRSSNNPSMRGGLIKMLRKLVDQSGEKKQIVNVQVRCCLLQCTSSSYLF